MSARSSCSVSTLVRSDCGFLIHGWYSWNVSCEIAFDPSNEPSTWVSCTMSAPAIAYSTELWYTPSMHFAGVNSSSLVSPGQRENIVYFFCGHHPWNARKMPSLT